MRRKRLRLASDWIASTDLDPKTTSRLSTSFFQSIKAAFFHSCRSIRSQNRLKASKDISVSRTEFSHRCRQATVTDYDSDLRSTGQQRQNTDRGVHPFIESETILRSFRANKVAEQQRTKSTVAKMLLDLPPEILEMILLVLPADSFAVMLMTSKTIRAAILATPKILRTQLLKIPGLRPPDQATIGELLKAFNQRAALSAWNGLEAFSDIVLHRPELIDSENELWTKPKFNWIQRCCPKGCERGVLATAADWRGVISVYRIRKGRIAPLCTLDPRTLGLDEDESPRIRYTCVAMRWQRCNNSHLDHLVALFGYSVEGFTKQGPTTFVNEFISEATEKAERTYHLCGWKLCKDTNKPAFGCEVQCPVLGKPDSPIFFRPIHITTTEDYCSDYTCYPVAIIFRSDIKKPSLYKISIYQVSSSKTVHVPVKVEEVDGVGPPGHLFPTAITRARFTPGRNPELWLYGADTAPLDTVTGCVTSGITALKLTSVNSRWSVPPLFSSKASPVSFRGLAIRDEHAHECGVYENGNKYCVQTILELVIPRNKLQGAFIIKYAEEQESCSPFDLNLELPALEYTVVAKLLGSDEPTSSPMKRIIALSPDKDWIAIADWNSVKLWGVRTQAFLKQEEGSLPETPPPPSGNTLPSTYVGKQNKALQREFYAQDDKAYTTNCAQAYFHDHILIKGKEAKRIVGIQPIELPSRGVVFSMAFSKRNILWAWTDRGLVKWAWGRKRTGIREELPLQRVPESLCGNLRW